MKINTYSDALQYLEDMRDFAIKARSFSAGRSLCDLEQDEQYRFSILYALQVIGEAASKVPSPVTNLSSGIAWRLIIGFRHVVVHGYGAVRLDVVQSILDEELIP